jgi:hypothetical protein
VTCRLFWLILVRGEKKKKEEIKDQEWWFTTVIPAMQEM